MGPLSKKSVAAGDARVCDAGSCIIAYFDDRCLDTIEVSWVTESAHIAAYFAGTWVVGYFFFCAETAGIRDAHARFIACFDFSRLDAVGVGGVAEVARIAAYFVCTWVVVDFFFSADIAGIRDAGSGFIAYFDFIGFHAVGIGWVTDGAGITADFVGAWLVYFSAFFAGAAAVGIALAAGIDCAVVTGL